MRIRCGGQGGSNIFAGLRDARQPTSGKADRWRSGALFDELDTRKHRRRCQPHIRSCIWLWLLVGVNYPGKGGGERRSGCLLEWNRRAGANYAIRQRATRNTSGLRLVWSGRQVQLHHAEAAFRIHKTDLRIRPIWHQREDRVSARMLVCFLVFATSKTLEGWQQRAGLGSSPRTLLKRLRLASFPAGM